MGQSKLVSVRNAEQDGRFRMGMKGLMVLVAACAFIIWAGLSIWDRLGRYQPLRVIHSGSVDERRIAAQDLSDPRGTEPAEAITALIRSQSDKDAGVRAVAAHSLGELVYQLRTHPPTNRADSESLKRQVDIAKLGLVRFISDRVPDVRAAAATGLGIMARAPGLRPPTPDQLVALRVGSNAVRRKTARMIYGSLEVALPSELVAALQDTSAEVRTAAVRALKSFATDLDPVIPALCGMMEHDEKDVRQACAETLEVAWPTPALTSTLIEFLKSPDRAVRYHAAQLLGHIGPEAGSSVPALIAVLKEPLVPSSPASYPDPARAAARALGLMGPRQEAIAALIEVISPKKVESNLSAFESVERLLDAGQSVVQHMPSWSGLVDIRPRLGNFGVLFTENFRIISTIQGLGDIGPPAVAAIPALVVAYQKALEVRHSMASTTIPEALGRIAPDSVMAPTAVAVLMRGLASNDGSLNSLGAVEALGHFGSSAAAAIPMLRSLKKGHSFLHDAAAKSLAAIEAQARPDADAKHRRRLPSGSTR